MIHTLALTAVLTLSASLAFADDAPTVRIMSFNVRYGTANDGPNHWDKRKDFLVETIKAFKPDLLGTQETLGFQRDYIAKGLEGYEAFGVGRDDGKDKGEMTALKDKGLKCVVVWLTPQDQAAFMQDLRTINYPMTVYGNDVTNADDTFSSLAGETGDGLITAALIVGSALLLNARSGTAGFTLAGYPLFALIGFLLAFGLGIYLVVKIILVDRY